MKVWIARDKDGGAWMYNEKPIKGDETWGSNNTDFCYVNKSMEENMGILKDVRWEDEEPTEVEITIVKKGGQA